MAALIGRDVIRRLALTAVIIVGGVFRFHGLQWHGHAWPHPDERAMVSQTVDMLAADTYRPTIHTWGHLGYYSALFAYKAYAHLQSQASTLPNLRDVSDLWLMVVGIGLTLLLCLVPECVRRLPTRWRAAVGALGAAAIVWAFLYGVPVMLRRVAPDFTDVAIAGRFLAALVSTLSLAVVYALGARLYTPAVGVLAAAFLAVSLRAVQLAHFFAAEPLQTFNVLLALLAAAALLRSRPSQRGDLGKAAVALALYLALGVAVGAAMASKFSSAPLLALPLVTHVLVLRRRSDVWPLALHASLTLCAIAVLGTWYALQPYAWDLAFEAFQNARAMPALSERWLHILFSREFAEQIAEQSRMVRGEGGGPWVQQFVDTKPYVTATLEMLRWSFGWPLGVVCVGGLFYTALRSLARPRAEDLLLLSYAGLTFAITGSFKASFPRYLLPVMAVACVLGARVCVDLHQQRRLRHLASLAALLALAAGGIYCTAFMRIYSSPHSWTTASLWLYKNVPPVRSDGDPTRIAHEEWDDQIPVSVPPYTSGYGSVTIAPYDGDGPEKAARLAQALADSDWVALPTSRVYSTILEVDDRYPVTAAYYRLLFAGRLGFVLRKTVYQPPEVWGIRLYDLSADESHYIYDHPKAVIFEKVEALPPDRLAQRIIAEATAPAPLLSRADVMRARESVAEQLRNLWRDPYAVDAVVTAPEVDHALERAPQVIRERLRRQLQGATAHPAVRLSDVRHAVARVDANERIAAGSLRAAFVRLRTEPAYRASDVAALATRRDVVPDDAVRTALVQTFSAPLEATHVSRSALLQNLAAIDWTVPRATDVSQRPAWHGFPVRIIDTRGRLWQLWDVLKWLVVLEGLGLAVWPLTRYLFATMPDRGFGVSRILGWVVTTYVTCGIALMRPHTSFASIAPVALAVVALVAWLPRRLRSAAASLPPLKGVLATELIFLATFLGFAAVRAYNPAIHWGEKTMDFSLLNSVMRAGTLPPYEAWFAGVGLNYYYYGYYLIAVLTQLTATPTAVAYNLSMAAIPALTVTAAFSVAYNLTRSLRWALAGVLAVGLLANSDAAFQVIEGAPASAGLASTLEESYATYGRTIGGFVAVGQWAVRRCVWLFTAPVAPTMWDSYWASSRALGPGMINEYPLWSWLFADLHAHVIVMPVSLLCVATIWLLVSLRAVPGSQDRVKAGAVLLLLALVVGTQLASNSWDFFAYAGLLVLGLLATARRPTLSPVAGEAVGMVPPEARAPSGWRSRGWVLRLAVGVAWVLAWPALCRLHPYWLGLVADHWVGAAVAGAWLVADSYDAQLRRALARAATASVVLLERVGVPALATLVSSVLLFARFHASFDTSGASLRWNHDGTIGAIHVIRHFGLFVLLTALWVALRVGRSPRRLAWLAAAGTVTLAALAALGWWSMGGFRLYALLTTAAAVVASFDQRLEHRFAGLLLVAGWGLAAVTELVVLGDRMNTVFKLYHPAWMLLALGSVGALANAGQAWRRSTRLVRHVALSCVCVAALVAVAGAYRAVHGVLTRELKVSNTPTLDGLDFLRHTQEERELLQAVAWLNARGEGVPVVAEAFTDRGYDGSARIAKYTGLPIVVGWPHHLSQRGIPPAQISQRALQLRRLYTTRDAGELSGIAFRHDIRYVVVGDLERQQYGDAAAGLASSPVTHEVFRSSSGRYVIYEIARRHD